jgi:hypothetical protein
MDEIVSVLWQIVSDLNLIKKRLGINISITDLSPDHDLDQDPDCDLFKTDCKGFDIDLDGFDLVAASRSIKYYTENRWRIKNHASYIRSMLKKYSKSAAVSSGGGPAVKSGKTGDEKEGYFGFKYDDLIQYLPLVNQSILDWYFERYPKMKRIIPEDLSKLTEDHKVVIIAMAKKEGRLQ